MANTVEQDVANVVINYLMSKPGEHALGNQVVTRVLLDPKVSLKLQALLKQQMRQMTWWQRWRWLLWGG